MDAFVYNDGQCLFFFLNEDALFPFMAMPLYMKGGR